MSQSFMQRLGSWSSRRKNLLRWTTVNLSWILMVGCVAAGIGSASFLGIDSAIGGLVGAVLYWTLWIIPRIPTTLSSLGSADRVTAGSAALGWGAAMGVGIAEFAKPASAVGISLAAGLCMWASLTWGVTWYSLRAPAAFGDNCARLAADGATGIRQWPLRIVCSCHWVAHPPLVLAAITALLAGVQVAVALELRGWLHNASGIIVMLVVAAYISWRERDNDYIENRRHDA